MHDNEEAADKLVDLIETKLEMMDWYATNSQLDEIRDILMDIMENE